MLTECKSTEDFKTAYTCVIVSPNGISNFTHPFSVPTKHNFSSSYIKHIYFQLHNPIKSHLCLCIYMYDCYIY